MTTVKPPTAKQAEQSSQNIPLPNNQTGVGKVTAFFLRALEPSALIHERIEEDSRKYCTQQYYHNRKFSKLDTNYISNCMSLEAYQRIDTMVSSL